jgi:divalent metal cation (Fe/Co/Zn/Cd) transporter
MTVEVALSIFAGVRARSVALTAFGGDSAIELLSAATVLWRFRSVRLHAEAIATKITGSLLIALGVYIATESLYTLLAAKSKPEPTYLGIGLLAASAFVMPWLGRRKRRLAVTSDSASLSADAAQSSICGYMAVIALSGLLLNAVAHLSWADPVAALGLLPIVVKEAREALQGNTCSC